ncbi:MAG: tol-pal system YbgF family protein [Candidatus Freyarchaeota archaeon]
MSEKDCEALLNKARSYESQATGTVAGQEYIEKAADKLREAGDCYFKLKNYEKALNCYTEAYKHHKKINYTVSAAMDSERMARCYQNLGKKVEFEKFMQEAAATYAEQGEKMSMAGNLVSAALLYSDSAIAYKALSHHNSFKNCFELAAQNYSEYAEMLLEEKDYGYAAANLGWAAMCSFAISNFDDAVKKADKALELCSKNNIKDENYDVAALSKAICSRDPSKSRQLFDRIKDNLSESEIKIVNECLENLG